MIFLIIFRYIFGYVRFKISSDYPEKAINIIKNAGITIWNIRKNGNDISANVWYRDYKKILNLCFTKNSVITIVAKRGIIFSLQKYKMRYGFLLGAVLFMISLFILPEYVWNINIYGNKDIKTNQILSALNELGVYEGAKINKIDARTIPSELKLKISDIAWVAVNIEGAVANVEITERVIADVEDTEPSNLIASQDGCVVSIKSLSGTSKVKVGQTVRKGDLLVSGVLEFKNGKNEFTRSHGEIICRTREKITVKIPYEQKSIIRTDKVKSRAVLSTPFFDLPLFLEPIKYSYQKYINTNLIEYNNNYVPIRIITAKFYETKENIIMIDEDTALILAENELKQREDTLLSNAKIVAREVKIIKNNDAVSLKAEYICEKNIAFEEKIIFGTVN